MVVFWKPLTIHSFRLWRKWFLRGSTRRKRSFGTFPSDPVGSFHDVHGAVTEGVLAHTPVPLVVIETVLRGVVLPSDVGRRLPPINLSGSLSVEVVQHPPSLSFFLSINTRTLESGPGPLVISSRTVTPL